jgi:two-component system, sensor histidine kinase
MTDDAPRRILVVDDNVDSAESMAVLLRLKGYDVLTLHTGERVLATARGFRPDVMLLDIGLPEMTGYDVARAVRAAPDGAAVKLVAVSGYGRTEDRERARLAGFDEHLMKPVDFDALFAAIGPALSAGHTSSGPG